MGRIEQPEINGRNGEGKFTKGNPFGWRPGVSGNPSGRPKGSKSGTSALRRMARAFVDPKSGLSAEELIASKLIAAAIDGNLPAIKEFYDRLEGKAGIRVELETEIMDWREKALAYGLDQDDVFTEAKLLVESTNGPSGSNADSKA
ncbi:MAG: hypothetical protein IPG22_20410 [Acidobacteria bacterium]|nr:hypothetical protein [Acidobacteriota bacterium]